MRKHHKRTVCQGEQPQMEIYLCHWWQRGRDLSDAEDRGIVLGGSDLSNAEDRGMVSGGAWLIWFQCYIRVISLVQKGRDYSEEDQRNSDRGSIPKRRMALCHWCQRGRDNHIDVFDVYWWERLMWRDSHIDYWCRTWCIYMLTSIIGNWCWHQCWYFHQCQRGRLLDHVVIDANGLIDWCQRIDLLMIDVI